MNGMTEGDWIGLAGLDPEFREPIKACRNPSQLRRFAVCLAKLARSKMKRSYDVLDHCIRAAEELEAEPPPAEFTRLVESAYSLIAVIDGELTDEAFIEARLASVIGACCEQNPMKGAIESLIEYREYVSFDENAKYDDVISIVRQLLAPIAPPQ